MNCKQTREIPQPIAMCSQLVVHSKTDVVYKCVTMIIVHWVKGTPLCVHKE